MADVALAIALWWGFPILATWFIFWFIGRGA